MKLTKIAGACKDNEECPAVYVTERGTFAVQGYLGRELLTKADPEIHLEYKQVAIAASVPFLDYEKALGS